jgi:hypothetical protein
LFLLALAAFDGFEEVDFAREVTVGDECEDEVEW